MQLALSVYVVVELAVPDRRRSAVAARARRHAVGRERGVDAVLALVCAYAALLVPLVVLIGQLALFHAMLVRRGLTTYEYILGEQRVDERPSAPPRTILGVIDGMHVETNYSSGPLVRKLFIFFWIRDSFF